jgi:hypothetical protein
LLAYGCSIAGVGALALVRGPGDDLWLWSYVLLFGGSMGSRGPMISTLATLRYRGANLGRIYGLICIGMGLGCFFGAWVGGLADAAAALAPLAKAGLTGLVIDYEPVDNYTAAHATAFASYLSALAAALKPLGLSVGMDIAGWTILAPNYWPIYVAAGGVSRSGRGGGEHRKNSSGHGYLSSGAA